jgi:hypothetical protein
VQHHLDHWVWYNKCRQSTPPLKDGGRIIVHPSEKCEIFNQYFSKISHREEEPELPTENINPVNSLPDFLITEEEVRSLLRISSFSYGAVHKRFIIRSNNYYLGGDMFVTHSVNGG